LGHGRTRRIKNARESFSRSRETGHHLQSCAFEAGDTLLLYTDGVTEAARFRDGYKQSGNGREYGRFGLEEFLETKAIQR
jgi:serine phosphatase RsbU (regulator of sigma subunit)